MSSSLVFNLDKHQVFITDDNHEVQIFKDYEEFDKFLDTIKRVEFHTLLITHEKSKPMDKLIGDVVNYIVKRINDKQFTFVYMNIHFPFLVVKSYNMKHFLAMFERCRHYTRNLSLRSDRSDRISIKRILDCFYQSSSLEKLKVEGFQNDYFVKKTRGTIDKDGFILKFDISDEFDKFIKSTYLTQFSSMLIHDSYTVRPKMCSIMFEDIKQGDCYFCKALKTPMEERCCEILTSVKLKSAAKTTMVNE